MKLHFEEVTGKPQFYKISDTCWFPSENEDSLLSAAATISVSRRDSQTVVLEGTLNGQRLTACDRCREQVIEPLSCAFEYLITTREEQAPDSHDTECSDEDAATLYLEGTEIDVDEILREQAFLAFPLKTLCSDDCKGICAGCGVVLNRELCRCPAGGGNSAFAILKKLTHK